MYNKSPSFLCLVCLTSLCAVDALTVWHAVGTVPFAGGRQGGGSTTTGATSGDGAEAEAEAEARLVELKKEEEKNLIIIIL